MTGNTLFFHFSLLILFVAKEVGSIVDALLYLTQKTTPHWRQQLTKPL